MPPARGQYARGFAPDNDASRVNARRFRSLMSQDPSPVSAPSARRCRFDRQLWLVTFIAACVVIPRAALVCMNRNESVDDDYHLRRGLLFWTREDVKLLMSN